MAAKSAQAARPQVRRMANGVWLVRDLQVEFYRKQTYTNSAGCPWRKLAFYSLSPQTGQLQTAFAIFVSIASKTMPRRTHYLWCLGWYKKQRDLYFDRELALRRHFHLSIVINFREGVPEGRLIDLEMGRHFDCESNGQDATGETLDDFLVQGKPLPLVRPRFAADRRDPKAPPSSQPALVAMRAPGTRARGVLSAAPVYTLVSTDAVRMGPDKNRTNLAKHGIDFALAALVFADPHVTLGEDRIDETGERR